MMSRMAEVEERPNLFRKWSCAHSAADKGGMKNCLHTSTRRSFPDKYPIFRENIEINPKLFRQNFHRFRIFNFYSLFLVIFIFTTKFFSLFFCWVNGHTPFVKIFPSCNFHLIFSRFSTLKPRIKLQNSTTCQWY